MLDLKNMIKKISILHCLILLALASVWIIYNQHGSINDDGGLYIRQAYFFAKGDYRSAVELYSWPLFGLLISTVHQITNLPLLYAAHTVDVLCFLIAAYFFFKTLLLLSHDKNILLAGFIVIITSIPLMDNYLAMILRDHGMWAGFMSGIYFYFKWRKTPNLPNSLAWQLSFLVGALFRPEVLMFNLLLPFVNAVVPLREQSRMASFFQSLSVLIFLGLGLLIILAIKFNISQVADLGFARLTEFYERPMGLIQTFLMPLPVESTNGFLRSVIRHHPMILKFSFLSAVVVYKWLAAIGLFHLGLTYIALKRRLLSGQHLRLLIILFLMTLLVSIANFYLSFVDTNRYWLMSYWLVYLVASLGLAYWLGLLSDIRGRLGPVLKLASIVVVAAYAFTVLFDSKPHRPKEPEVIAWLKQHQVNLDEVFFNDRRLIIYAERYEMEIIELAEAIEKRYPYIALRVSEDDAVDGALKAYERIHQFDFDGRPYFELYKRID